MKLMPAGRASRGLHRGSPTLLHQLV